MLQYRKFKIYSIIFLIIGFILVACEKNAPDIPGEFKVVAYDPVPVTKTNNTVVWAHFMPWFETKETSSNGKWGMHWTMNTKNPDVIDGNGKREIASHYYPLTGIYASNDPHIIEYQLLLMKYCGIDGILIDWYGSSDWNDYGSNRRNSEAIIEAIDEVGLKFAIVYEDRTIPEVVKKDNTLDRISAAQADMQYLQDNYFNNPSYITINDKPLLLVFGPEEFLNPNEWGDILSVLNTQPCLMPLNGASYKTKPYSSGEYIWVDNSSLDNKYGNMTKFDVYIAGAYPGFNDYYYEGGWGAGFSWSIDFKEGETFTQNLQKARNAKSEYVQLITWNDYGEGTMIEPTIEFGYSLLEIVQDFAGVTYSLTELQKIKELYDLRKKVSSNETKFLDQAFYFYVSLQNEKGHHLIDSLKNTIQSN